ncbi:MAG: 50S ribosome-binding GTPase, partial [Gammaproteobacteria bacterium]|nr:50S ribosome-binding GTPase [Gammaproteobacteria bacterium]
FVIADIPGIIEGAAEGVGLGLQFLRHIKRTRLLLHLVDATAEDPAEDIRTIEHELEQYDAELLEKPRWLVLNKCDAIGEEQAAALRDHLREELDWNGPFYVASGLAGMGCRQMMFDIQRQISERNDDDDSE